MAVGGGWRSCVVAARVQVSAAKAVRLGQKLRAGADLNRPSDAKKKTLIAAEQDRPAVARLRRRWRAHQHRIDPDRLVFLDETWIRTDMTRVRGWCQRGTPLLAKVPHGRWRTLTFIAGLAPDRDRCALRVRRPDQRRPVHSLGGAEPRAELEASRRGGARQPGQPQGLLVISPLAQGCARSSVNRPIAGGGKRRFAHTSVAAKRGSCPDVLGCQIRLRAERV